MTARKLDPKDPFGSLAYEQMRDAIATVEAMARRAAEEGEFLIEADVFENGLRMLRRKVTSIEQAVAWSDFRSSYGARESERNAFIAGWEAARVCSGCGTDDGNWQAYPCPTIRALEDNR